MKTIFWRIVAFFDFWRSPDWEGDPITASTAWEVANILYPRKGKSR